MIERGRSSSAGGMEGREAAMAEGSGDLPLARFLSGLGLLLLVWTGWDLWRISAGTGTTLGRFSSSWAAAFAGFVILGLSAGAFAAWVGLAPARFVRFASALDVRLQALGRGFRFLLAAMFLVAAVGLLRVETIDTLQRLPVRLLILAGFSLGLGAVLPLRSGGAARLALAVMSIAAATIVVARLSLVTDFPFSLGWSEGNRLWDYSLYFRGYADQTDGSFTYPTYLTPGRHGLWGLPFLLPDVSIFVVRLWDAVLWTAPYLALGLTLLRRGRSGAVSFGLWSLLFLHQGPIYAPLVLSAVFVAAGYDARRPGRSALITAMACFYAGLSRWTWIVAPALWASLWSLLASPSHRSWPLRLKAPALLGLAGLAGAVASQVVMQLAFPQPDAPFATTARQALLWYRLMPSATNPHGIVPALAVVVGPLLLLLGVSLGRRWLRWDGLQAAGVAAVLLATLAVGLAASVKIGGGNNLHNLDMFLVTLVFLAGIGLLALGDAAATVLRKASPLLALVILVPAAMAVPAGDGLELPGEEKTAHDLRELRQAALESAAEGPVLFIDQRQLFAFSQLPGVPLVMDYELKDLMNQAMGANRATLDRFEQDLAAHRFSLIVVDPLPTTLQGRYRAFGEENDAWVTRVSWPILESYRQARCFEAPGVCLYVPRP